MKTKIKNFIKKGILILLLSLFFSCQTEDINYVDSEFSEAIEWFEKNHNPLIEQNKYYKGHLDWQNINSIDDMIYIPLSSSANKIITLNEDKEITNTASFYPYVSLKRIDNNIFEETFTVFIDKKSEHLKSNLTPIDLPYMSFSSENLFIESSFKSSSSNNTTNVLTKNGSDCITIDWYIITTYSDGSTTETYIGSTVDCNNQGLDDGLSSGGGGSTQSYDDWNRLTDCEKDFFKSNPSTVFSVTENRKKAEEATSRLFPTCGLRNTIADAFRHAYFSALNTKSIGYTNASKLGDAHECETPASELSEKIMDLRNNSWGYNYSLTHINLTESQFYQDFIIADNNGKIKTLKPCN